jgi:3-methyladenine DNA glycosylase AlkD
MPETRSRANRTASALASNIAARVAASADFSVAGLRPLRRQISGELRSEEPSLVLRSTISLLRRPRVPRWFVYELLHNHRALTVLQRRDVEQLGQGIANWGDVDAFGVYIAGPAFREGRLAANTIRDWARSPDRWWRRAALVATVALNNTARGGRGDADRTLAVCNLLRHDRDDMVVKALSWALRELAKKEPARVQAYLQDNADALAPRVLREVKNKLRTGLKNPKAGKPG